MKKVDIIYFGWLLAPNGVSKFTTTLQENKSSFEKENISLFFYSLDNIKSRNFKNGVSEQSDSLKERLKKFLFEKAISNAIVSFYVIWRRYFLNGKKVVKNYIQLKRHPDILYTNDMFTCYYLIKNRSNIGNTKIVFVLHTDGSFFKMLYSYYPRIQNSFFNKYLLNIKKTILNNIDKIGFVSRFSQNNFLIQNTGFPPNKSFYIHNGILDKKNNRVEKNEFKNKNQIILTCVGSVSHRKGHDIIVDSVIQLDPEIKKRIVVQFIGDGSLFYNLQEKCILNNIDNIKFLGSQSNVNNFLIESDLFILMSRDEGLPISIIEAMRCGLPIISTNIAGIPELVQNGFNGIIIEPEINQLVTVFNDIYNNKYDLKIMGTNSREKYLTSFTLDKMIQSYSELFYNL